VALKGAKRTNLTGVEVSRIFGGAFRARIWIDGLARSSGRGRESAGLINSLKNTVPESRKYHYTPPDRPVRLSELSRGRGIAFADSGQCHRGPAQQLGLSRPLAGRIESADIV